MKKIRFSFAILVLLLMAQTSYAYLWPFNGGSSGPHAIWGTMGEFRPESNGLAAHFHNGAKDVYRHTIFDRNNKMLEEGLYRTLVLE
ncbi:MAG: hypothetical protein OEV28_13765 [Nitrospirota bacterium]|nr:hypothetical protein [Nitrospirota bacterium]